MATFVDSALRVLERLCYYSLIACVLGLIIFGLDLSARAETTGCFVHAYGNQNVEFAWITTPFIVAVFLYAFSAAAYVELTVTGSGGDSGMWGAPLRSVGVSAIRTLTLSNALMLTASSVACICIYKVFNNVLTVDCTASSVNYNHNPDDLFGGLLAAFFSLRTVLNLGYMAHAVEEQPIVNATKKVRDRVPWWDIVNEASVAAFSIYMWVLFNRSSTGVLNNFIDKTALSSTDCKEAYTTSGWEPDPVGFGKLVYDAVNNDINLDPQYYGTKVLAVLFVVFANGLVLFDAVQYIVWLGKRMVSDGTENTFFTNWYTRLGRAAVALFVGVCMSIFAYTIVHHNYDPRCPILLYDNPTVRSTFESLKVVVILSVLGNTLSKVIVDV